ncbi:hypothetical protein [Staphylococcus saprophyticus]|uniref:hypothetical protein n=1 Tax=Staphylococcus saprophyticus TaxID=29385 RepID=UPI00374E87F7
MENILAIATIIAGLAGIFTIIYPFIKIYFDHKRYKEYLNQKSESFHKRIIKQANNTYQNEGQYKRASNHINVIISEFNEFLNCELEQKENIGKRKKIRKQIKKQRALLYKLIKKYEDAEKGIIQLEYRNIKREIPNYFLKF